LYDKVIGAWSFFAERQIVNWHQDMQSVRHIIEVSDLQYIRDAAENQQ